MRLHFIGTGYVGLVSGIMMSYLGHDVTCLDTDISKIDQLKKNILPIYEPKLAKYLPPLVKSSKLQFTASYSAELRNSQAVFITVGTPPLPSGEADLQYIFIAIDNLCEWINDDCLIVIKSTVPPTTCNQIIDYLKKRNLKFPIASNPEFLREGTAVDDFLNPDRILIGTNNKHVEDLLKKIYLPLTTKNISLICTDLVTAELTKYASNAFLATKTAFINEMANLCEKTGANIKELSIAMGLDKRIGKESLNTGPGFGGSCFPKDLLALSQIAEHYQCNLQIVNAVISSNDQRVYDMADRIHYIINDNLTNKNITVLGLTYKAGTDDIRSSPIIKIIKILVDKGANIKAFDPIGMDNAKKELKNIFFTDSALSACQNSDIIVVATEWSEFKDLDWSLIRRQVKSPIIIDFRHILDGNRLKALGFKYYLIGTQYEV
ncbi:UDP-glucose dehydrogenase family protein [Candidatus Tisiphia endosymbiont of Dioctria rufipes]|uniref:UDP-glucose dehydrogenase family protein n=1 Tax=Candidatus Tisiphia endosymbiont of Dioctria rufipes TaxID=3066255 RepID=UPI003977B76C